MRLPLLALHISAGSIGLLSGAAAVSFRKISDRYRAAGNVFVVSLLIIGLCVISSCNRPATSAGCLQYPDRSFVYSSRGTT
jgi:hypothetical protein